MPRKGGRGRGGKGAPNTGGRGKAQNQAKAKPAAPVTQELPSKEQVFFFFSKSEEFEKKKKEEKEKRENWETKKVK